MKQKQYILVTGGAGYIGSHMVKHLINEGYTPIVVDNLSNGHEKFISNCKLIHGDINDSTLLNELFSTYSIFAVIHFAAFISVPESIINPQKYYMNNTAGTLNLLNCMLKNDVNKIIFSSTAAVYGEPLFTPIDENHPIKPLSPYGSSKQMSEQLLNDYAKAYGLQYTILRYFNAAGADPSGQLVECHEPESHLIPLILEAIHQNKTISIYGTDYPTPDGTCIRDYIHVNDLCSAHLLALTSLLDGKKNAIYNLGTGKGYSVQEVINAAKKVTQQDLKVAEHPRRPGDPAVLVANSEKALLELNWKIKYPNIETIIEHAWNALKHHQPNENQRIADLSS